jgi:hypothetical protein
MSTFPDAVLIVTGPELPAMLHAAPYPKNRGGGCHAGAVEQGAVLVADHPLRAGVSGIRAQVSNLIGVVGLRRSRSGRSMTLICPAP